MKAINFKLSILAILGYLLICSASALPAADCNDNGVDDAVDIADGVSSDCNGNSIPDECDLEILVLTHLEPAFHLPTGPVPYEVTTEDFNDDGALDFAVGNSDSDNVTVFLNDGSGHFSETVDIVVTDETELVRIADLIAADFNRDLLPDLAVAVSSGVHVRKHITLLLNNNDGTAWTRRDFPGSGNPFALAAADFDRDGDNDLAVADGGGFYLCFNTGLGNLVNGPRYRPAGPVPPNIFNLTATDVDGDADTDIITANSGEGGLDGISVFKNSGTGTFAEDRTFRTGTGLYRTIAHADFDGDGDQDLAMHSGNTVGLFENSGNDSFTSWGSLSVAPGGPKGAGSSSLSPADLDGDGDIDLVVACRDTISVLINNGNGTMGEVTNFPTEIDPQSIAIADFNLDGANELITVNSYSDTVSMFIPELAPYGQDINENGVPDECEDCNENGTVDEFDIADSTSVDLNENGIPDECEPDCNDNDRPDDFDIATGESQDCNANGIPDECDLMYTGGFELKPSMSFGTTPESVVGADFDQDGDIDLATANYDSNNASVRLNRGSGTFASSRHFSTGSGSTSLTATDLDGDGYPDLAVANQSAGTLSVLLNEGEIGSDSVSFLDAVNYRVGLQPLSVTAADLDGDGDQDLAVANSALFGGTSNVSVMRNTGNGEFDDAVSYQAGTTPTCVRAADLDGDSHNDLVVTNGLSNNISILWNDKDGTFVGGSNHGVGGSPNFVAVADIDCDGDLDLAVANWALFGGTGGITLLRNLDNRTFGGRQDFKVGVPTTCVILADLHGDGDVDMVSTNFESNDVSVFLNQGCGEFVAPTHYAVGSGPLNVTAADLDGDRILDLAVANQTSSAVSVLINQASAFSQDCNENGMPDECDIVDGTSEDVNDNGIPDECDADCNENGVPDDLDIAEGTSEDADGDGIPDECRDCNRNGTRDPLDILSGTSLDCNENEIPDECDIAAGVSQDCNENTIPDECDIADGTAEDSNSNGIPDECEWPRFARGDSNDDGDVDISDAIEILGWLFLGDAAPGCIAVTDTNGDAGADLSDAVYLLGYLFLGGPAPLDPFPDCGPGTAEDYEGLGCETPPVSCQPE